MSEPRNPVPLNLEMPTMNSDRRVRSVCDKFRVHAITYYRKPSGRPTATIGNVDDAIRELVETPCPDPPTADDVLLGNTRADAMTAKRLYAVQQRMAASGRLCRRTVNDRIAWMVRMFKWAASPGVELVPEDVATRVAMLPPLKYGRSLAGERAPVTAVGASDIEATAAAASEKIRTMIRLQWLTGMRPTEVCNMRRSLINMEVDPWLYVVHDDHNKVAHWGKTRTVPIGPKAQALLRPWLERVKTDILFEGKDCKKIKPVPREPRPRSVDERRAEVAQAILADPGTSNQQLAASCRVSLHLVILMRKKLKLPPQRERRPSGKPMEVRSYRQEIERVNRKHDLKRWSPNQLRHAAATRLRAAAGLDAAQLMLGHSTTRTTEIYAQPDLSEAFAWARRFG